MAFRAASYKWPTAENQTAIAIDAPSGLADGDIMVALIVSWKDPADQTHTLPSGWTAWYEQRCTGSYGSNLFYTLCWKRASSESGSYTFSTSSGAAEIYGLISAYSGRIASGDPLDVGSNTKYETNDTTVRAAGMTVATAGSDVVWAAWTETYSTPSLDLPSGMNQRVKVAMSEVWSAMACGDLLNQSTGATGNKDGSCDSSTERKHAFMVALKPASGGASMSLLNHLLLGD